jgi:glutathione S-transferase
MNDATYKLISFSICPYVQRPRIVLLEKQIGHSIEYIDLQNPPMWFHEISPLEKVPVLLVDGQALFESMPICEYLDEITPGSLYPADPLRKAQHRAWIEFGNDVLSQHHALVSAGDETAFKKAKAVLAERFDTLEEVLGEGPYFAGEEFGMVDAVYAPIFRFTRHLKQLADLELMGKDTPKVVAWAEQLLARPSVQAAVPDSFVVDYTAYVRRQGGLLSRRLKNNQVETVS